MSHKLTEKCSMCPLFYNTLLFLDSQDFPIHLPQATDNLPNTEFDFVSVKNFGFL